MRSWSVVCTILNSALGILHNSNVIQYVCVHPCVQYYFIDSLISRLPQKIIENHAIPCKLWSILLQPPLHPNHQTAGQDAHATLSSYIQGLLTFTILTFTTLEEAKTFGQNLRWWGLVRSFSRKVSGVSYKISRLLNLGTYTDARMILVA